MRAKQYNGTFAQFITVARKLKQQDELGEQRLLELLISGERNEEMWRKGGFSSFERLLRDTDLYNPKHYMLYKTSIELIGRAKVKQIGVAGAILLAEIPPAVECYDADGNSIGLAMNLYRDHLISFTRSQKAPASRLKALNIRRSYYVKERVTRRERGAEIRKLKEENQRLREDNEILTQIIDHLVSSYNISKDELSDIRDRYYTATAKAS